jgi:O-antigen/teichoic acid export membrane protein
LNDSNGPDQQSLATKAVRSGAWIYGRNIVTSLINLGVMAVLARQLTPADFGLVALASVLLRFVVILSEGGIGEYIISDNQEGRERRVQAAFWLNLTLSIGIILIGLFVLPWIARFYDEPNLGIVIILLGVRYLFAQVTIVPHSLVRKDLRYNKLVVIDSVIEITSSLFSVILALTGWGALSLVIPGVVLEPLRTLWFMYTAQWIPRLPLRISEWRGVFRYSSKVIVGSLATTIGAEGDTLVIGKTLGSQSLGLYNLAWTNANMVHRKLVSPISNIALPAFSSIAQSKERTKDALHRMVRIISTTSYPLLVGLFVVADLFIITIYGPQWTTSITPLRILLIYALRYAIGSPANAVFYSFKRPDIPMKFSLVFIPVYLTVIILCSAYGIIGVAVGVTVVRTIYGLIQLRAIGRLADTSLSKILMQAWPAFIASLCMGLVVALARLVLAPLNMQNFVELGLLIALGGITYLVLLVFVFRNLWKELLAILDSFSPRLGGSMRKLIPYRS